MADDGDILENNIRDRLVAASRAVAGAVPWVGSVVGEFLAYQVKGQRLDRIAQYIRDLEERLAVIELSPEPLLANPACADLIEEGALQSARALNSDRIKQIASVVSRGLSHEEVEVLRQKRLLLILAELDDEEIMLLHAMALQRIGDHSGWDKIQEPERVRMGAPLAQARARSIYEAGRRHLLRLNLIEEKTSGAGIARTTRTMITTLGGVLLAETGLIST